MGLRARILIHCAILCPEFVLNLQATANCVWSLQESVIKCWNRLIGLSYSNYSWKVKGVHFYVAHLEHKDWNAARHHGWDRQRPWLGGRVSYLFLYPSRVCTNTVTGTRLVNSCNVHKIISMKVAVFVRRMLVAGELLAALLHPVHWRPLLGMLARIVKLCRWSFWFWQGNNISDAVTSAMMNQFARELTSSLLGKYFASTRVSVWWAENDSWRLHMMLESQAFVDALTF